MLNECLSTTLPGQAPVSQSGDLRQRGVSPALVCRRAAGALDVRPLGAALRRYGADPMISQPPILRFDNLTLGYRRHPAVHHLCGKIAAGSLLAVVGPNGAGKSTLLKGIVGDIPPMDGRIELQGVERKNIAYLTQQTSVDTAFPIVIYDFVALGLWHEFGAFRGLNRQAKRRIDEAIAAAGLVGLENRPIGQLSGGQLQRTRFARLMLQDSPLVLLDEPYSGVDVNSVRDLAALVRRWNAEGRTIISVLHDFEHVRHEYPQTLLLAREVVAWGATCEVLDDAHLAQARRLAEMASRDEAPEVCRVDDVNESALQQHDTHAQRENA